MKTPVFRYSLFLIIGFLSCISYGQEYNNFEVRYENNLRGDLIFLGNNILNRDSGTPGEGPNDAYNNQQNNGSFTGANDDNSGRTNYNDFKNMQYIDVDGDASTFSSSSSTLTFEQQDCNLIRYAGLYWTATYPSATANGSYDGSNYSPNNVAVGTGRQNDFNQVRFRVPGGAYTDVTADEVLFDGFTSADNSVRQNSPYACYADVTGLVTALADPTGEYTIANVRATTGGLTPGGGSAAGWTLIIVYENPTLTGKFITTFDGFARVRNSDSVDIDYSGFETIPAGPVIADFGAGTLEGDFRIDGDGLSIRAASNTGFTAVGNPANPVDNFFNSNISQDGVITTNRNPASTNTLGFDTDIFLLNNPANSVIPNGETAATFRFSTDGDQYYPFFNSFNIEIIEPNIILEKTVEDLAGNDITGAGVNLGQFLDYVLSFSNIGNDDATGYTIRDILPINTTLIETEFDLPPGVTYTYDPSIREVVFTIPDNLVEVGDPLTQIRMQVQVAENCFDFIDACTDLIANVAFSTYRGVINDAVISDDPSVNDFDACGFVNPGATNFLLDDLEACDFSRTVQLCGENALLDAGNNFDSYVWYVDENEDGLIDSGDTVIPGADTDMLTVTEPGVYIVDKIVADPCKGFQEIITVIRFGETQSNPITELINDTSNTVEGQIVVCPNDGEELPEIFLCGLNDTELIQINIPDADSIEWELLDEASCTAATEDCANKNNTCTWNTVETGGDFIASDAGQYRVVINYANGCFSRFYFNIFKNPLDPQFNSSDIICNTPGNITVTNLPLDYEFQLVDTTNDNILVPYSANNGPSFTIATNGVYRVEMRQQGVTDGCVFVLDNIGIRNRDFQVDVDTKDTDCNGLGEISISILNVEAQYYYEISQGGTSIDTFGPSNDNNYTFENLNDGVYDVLVTTDDGCTYTEQVTINDVSDIAVSAITTRNIDCEDGIITVTGSGGFPNPDYSYAIWSYIDEGGTVVTSYSDVSEIPAGEFQTANDFTIANGEEGDYQFVVIDGNNCPAISNTVTVQVAPAADFGPTTVVDVTCFGEATGSITHDLINSNGYSLTYYLIPTDDFNNDNSSTGVGGINTTDDNTDVSSAIATNNSGTFTNLPAGDYTVVISQTIGNVSCDFIQNYTISAPVDSVSANVILVQNYTCIQTGIIEAQNTTGGAAPYSYSIDGITFIPDTTTNANRFENLTDGTYTISIRDANGCIIVTPDIVIEPLNPPTDLTFTATDPLCPTMVSDVTATVVNGTAPYIFEIVAPSTIVATSTSGPSADFDGLSPNTYTFRVTDAKDCVYEETYTIAPISPITAVGQLVSNITCFGDTDGEARFTVANFNTSFDYSITGPSTFSGTNETNGTIDLTNLDDGTYTITVTDNDTNCTATTNVTINGPPAPISITTNETQPTCTTPGSAQITATGGWGSYTYVLNNPDTTPVATNTNGAFNNLTQIGIYNGTVTDVNGCEAAFSFELFDAISPDLTLTPNDFCYDDATGLTLTATVSSGGAGNFEYSLNNGPFNTTNVFTGLGPGTYRVDVRDGNNCTDFETITINSELSVTASAANITACATATDVNITAAGGDGNYVYSIVADGASPGTFSNTNPVTVTGAGDYDVYVRDNAGGTGFCEASFDITINQDAPLAISVSNTAILCSGESSSTITINASGGEAPYRYSINNGTTYQTTNTFFNQAAGSYNIIVQDANNCEVIQTYTITEPFTLSASAAVTELVECNPSAGAEVRITNAQGGTTPYSYSFNGGVSFDTSSIGYLMPGTHTLYIRDANNCDYPMTVTVDPQPTPPTATAAVEYECDGEGTITVTPDSADFDYTYELNSTTNTPETSNVFTNVPVGTHTVTVNYVSNTPVSPSNLLLEDFGVGSNTSITEIDPVYCYEPQDGSPSCPGFGTDPFIQDGEYSVTQNIDNLYTGWVNPNDHTGNAGGRFLAINVGGVAGVNGIVYAKRGVEVIPNRDVTISLWAFNIIENNPSYSHLGDPSVVIQLVDAGGAEIASTSTTDIPKNNNANDWHNYSVVLNPGANSNLDIVIRTNSAVVQGNDIAIDDIEAFQTPEPCPDSFDIEVIVEPGNDLAADVTNFTNVSCFSGNDGVINFEVENFDTTFEYQVNGGGFSAPQSTSPISLTGLSAGNFVVDIRTTDNLGNTCSVQFTQTLTQPTAIAVGNTLTQPTCVTDASVTINASGGTPNYTYEIAQPNGAPILGPQTSNIFTGLDEIGLHTITVTDANGCTQTDTFTTVPASNPVASIDPASNLCFSSANSTSATVVVGASGGVAPYLYSINSGPTRTSNMFTNLTPGSYTFTVTDANGCTDTVAQDIAPTITGNLVLTKDIDCTTSPGAELSLNGSGGYSPFTFEINIDGAGYVPHSGPSPTSSLSYSTGTAGTYQFRITDAEGCSAESNTVIVTNPVSPQASENLTDPTCNGDSNGIIEINVDTNFGVPPYLVSFNGGAFTSQTVYPGLAAGTYSYTVTDANSCTYTNTVTLNDPALFTANVTPYDVSCGGAGVGDIPGRIEIDIPGTSGGVANFTYTLYDNLNNVVPTTGPNPIVNTPNTSIVFDGLSFGDYYVRIIDANGCEYYENPVRIFSNPYLTLTSNAIADCASGGTVDVTADSGSGNYTFSIFGPGTAPDNVVVGAGTSEIATFNGLNAGQTYTFEVIDDDTSCSSYVTVDVPSVSLIDVVADPVVNDVSCFGNTNGSIAFQIEQYETGVSDIYYEVRESITNNAVAGLSGTISPVPPSPGPTALQTIYNIPPGDYTLYFEEVQSPFCSNTYAFRVIEPNPVRLSLIDQNNGNCNEDAQVTVIASGGNGTFTYAFVEDGVAPVPGDYTPNNYAELDPATNTDWDVYVLDGNDCSGPALDITIADDPSPIISGVVTNQCAAEEGGFIIEITLDNIGIGPYRLSSNGGAFENTTLTTTGDTFNFNNLSSGNYSIELIDGNNCGNTIALEIFTPTSISADVTAQPTCLGMDGEILVTAYGGSGVYLYELFTSGGVSVAAGPQATGLFTGLDADIYTAFIYDQVLTGCNASVAIEAEVPSPVSFTTTATDVTCFGGTDGTITAILDPGMNNPPYTYQLFDDTGLVPQSAIQNSNVFTGLTADDYIVRVYSGRGCLEDEPETVGSPSAINVPSPSVVEFGCVSGNNSENATITVSGMTGGSNTFVRYRFFTTDDPLTLLIEPDVEVQNNNNNNYTETDFNGGYYEIEVFDSNGCIGSTNARILPFDELLTATATYNNDLSCAPGTDGSITINATSTANDTTRFEYSIDNGASYQVSNVFAGLGAGTYNFLVRHLDTGCIISASETIAAPDVLELDVVSTSNIICFGSATGSADFDLNDGAGTTYASPINYTLRHDVNNTPTDDTDDVTTTGNDTDGAFTITNLAAGTYFIDVTEANFPNCTYTQSFTIASPSAAITADTQVTDITCVPGNDGVIEIIDVVGGWGGYQYYVDTASNPDEFDITNYGPSPRFENLSAGTYEIWVIDQLGCPLQLTDVTLANPTPIVADLRINDFNCINLQGEIEVVGIPATDPISGGQGSNYTYQLIRNGVNVGSPQNTTVFSGLGAGSYEVYIIDQWGCDTTVGPVVLTDAMTATAAVIKQIDCTVDPGGQITITVNGGSTNLDYTVTYPISSTTVSQNNGVFTNLTEPGEYVFVVTDLDTATPCTVEVRQSLDDKVDPVLLDATIASVSCFGGSDGSITAVLDPTTATNPAYTYELYRTSDLVTPFRAAQASPLFENLNADSYQIRVISSRACEDRKIETVTEPTELLIDATASIFECAANNTVNVSTITVAILDGATTPGTPSGTSPYLYSIDNVNYQTSNTFEIIDNGTDQTINVFVTDGGGCPATDTVTITTINSFTAAVTNTIDISCANPEEVTITVTETGTPGDVYSFELLPIPNSNGVLISNTNTTAIFELSAVGSYTFRVTNTTTGCYMDTAPYEIVPYDLIDVVATATTPVSCFGTATGALEINITGYTGNYDYQIFDSANNPIGAVVSTDTSINPREITNLTGGNYYVRVTETDVPLCSEDSNTITIASPAAPLSTIVSVEAPPTCDNDQGEILVTPTGGYAPYDIVLTNTTTGQVYSEIDATSFAFTGLSAGSFTIEVSDSGAVPCIDNATETIAPAVPITADITATPTLLTCFGDTNATVTATNVLNGSGQYLYQLNEYDATGTAIAFTGAPQNSPSFGNLGAGIYSITVSDGWNCDRETVQVTISEPTDVMASLIQLTQMTCTNGAEIQLTASGGTAPYEFSEDGVTYTAMSGGDSHVFNVTEGVYQYFVRDDFGCEAMISNQISIDPIPPLTITIDDSAAFINCTGEASATIIANVTGGLGNYSYELYTDALLTNLVTGPQTNNTFSGLVAGSYYVRVTSQDCEEVSGETLIVDPAPLQIDREEFTNVSCSGLEDGTIAVEVSGGTGEIQYAITPNLNQFDTVNTFDGLAPGIYDVIAQDMNGCFIAFQFTIIEPQPIDLSAVSVIDELCQGEANGSIEIEITGGTAPYSAAFNSNADADFVQDQTLFTDLTAGTYVIFVRDAQGCEENIIVEIEPGY